MKIFLQKFFYKPSILALLRFASQNDGNAYVRGKWIKVAPSNKWLDIIDNVCPESKHVMSALGIDGIEKLELEAALNTEIGNVVLQKTNFPISESNKRKLTEAFISVINKLEL